MEWEEVEEKIKESMKPYDQVMRELISELDGKNMDYESCRILEDAIKVERGMWLEALKQIIEKIKLNKTKNGNQN